MKVKVHRSVSWTLSRMHSTGKCVPYNHDALEKTLLEGCVDDIVDDCESFVVNCSDLLK